MMIKRRCLIYTFCSLLVCLSGIGSLSSATELLCAGSFHGDEISANSGQSWYGMYRKQKGYELKASKILVRTVKDLIVDTTTSTGKEVLLDVPGETLFLVRDLAGLKNGPVHSSFVGDREKFLHPGQSLSLMLGSRKYTLSVSGKVPASPTDGLAEYALVLSDGVHSQTIASEKDCNDVRPRLIWAGDLDHDGRLDLLVDASRHYNVSSRILWVSRGATQRQLVRPAAKFETSGC